MLPGERYAPSCRVLSSLIVLSTVWKTARATSSPASTSASFASKCPCPRACGGTVASVVISPYPTSSSRRRVTSSRNTKGEKSMHFLQKPLYEQEWQKILL